MTLPAAVRAAVERQVGAIRSMAPVGGGCISDSWRLETADGPIFLKHHASAPARMFAAEAEGLGALRAAAGNALSVPAVVAIDEEGDTAAWIALEWLEPGPRGPGFGERLGRGLAALHRADAAGGWGWARPNYIATLPQENAPSPTWGEFWRDRRILPQLRLAAAAGRDTGPRREWDRLIDALPDLLSEAEGDGPSLLHGDLWSGNVLSASGDPAIVDPAVYHGHREVDLAMADLFGGFDARFHAAYARAWPLRPGYREVRRGIYQLYYLLVHVNLFGGGYSERTVATLRGIGR